MLHSPPVASARGRSAGRTAGPGRRLRVLMVAPTSFFADYGCHVRILEETRALMARGVQVTVVTYHNGRDLPGLDVRRTLPIPWRNDYEVGSSRHKLAFDGLLLAATLRQALALRPDVIHGHLHEGALIGGVVARLLGLPLVFDFQGSLTAEMVDHGFLNPRGRLFEPVRRLEGWINGLPNTIVTSSLLAARLLERDFRVSPERVVPLPDGVAMDTFRPGLLDQSHRQRFLGELGVPSDVRIVAYLGLLAAHQGTDHLLAAAAKVTAARPDAHFLVMGFPGTDLYQAQARQAGLRGRITFTGRVAYESAPFHLALADVAVAAKLSTTEGSGKLLNYMAMALPVAAFDTAVSREYLGELGTYAAAGDADALAAGILYLLDNPSQAADLGRRLRQRAELFGWESLIDRLLAVYDELVPHPAAELS